MRKLSKKLCKRAPGSDPGSCSCGSSTRTSGELQGKLGNRRLAQLVHKRPSNSLISPSSPSVAAVYERFGVSPASVCVRSTDAFDHGAQSVASRGFTDGHKIGLRTRSTSGLKTLAHELAHVVQRRGGNVKTASQLKSIDRAEIQARQSASAALAGRRPQVGAFRFSGLLFDTPKSRRQISRVHTIESVQIREWVQQRKSVPYQVARLHLLRLYPGAREQDVYECLKDIINLHLLGKLERQLRKGRKTVKITIYRELHSAIQKWIKNNRSVDIDPPVQSSANTGGNLRSQPGQAKTQDPLKRPRQTLTTTEDDGRRHTWPVLAADPMQRRLILALMKEIVGEAMKLPEDQASKVPSHLSDEEVRYLLQIVSSKKETRDAIVAKLRTGTKLEGSATQTRAQVLESALADVALEKHAPALGVTLDKSSLLFAGDPAARPIENRPVRGSIINLTGPISPGERSVWSFSISDERLEVSRRPHVYIAWAAFRKHKRGNLEKVAGPENKHYMPSVQGARNACKFDFSPKEPGAYIIKAIVNHNYYRPAYFEEPFIVEQEYLQARRLFTESHGSVVKPHRRSTSWRMRRFSHGEAIPYREGYSRTGWLTKGIRATTNDDLIKQLASEKEALRKLVDTAMPSREEAMKKAYNERVNEIDEQMVELWIKEGAVPLVVRGTFVSRRGSVVRDVRSLSLACSLREEKAADGSRFRLYLHDTTPRASRKAYHFQSEPMSDVRGAQEHLFSQMADAYPEGTLSVLFQDYDHLKRAPRRTFVHFEKKTDTRAKEVKSALFSGAVGTAIDVAGIVLALFPPTAKLGIGLLVVHGTVKNASEMFDNWKKTGKVQNVVIPLADLVMNLLPLAPKIVKVGRKAYYLLTMSSVAGGLVLMPAVGLEQVRKLRADYIDEIMRMQKQYNRLKRDNAASPLIVEGTLKKEIEKLKNRASTAGAQVFGELVSQLTFMYVASHATQHGWRSFKRGSRGTPAFPQDESGTLTVRHKNLREAKAEVREFALEPLDLEGGHKLWVTSRGQVLRCSNGCMLVLSEYMTEIGSSPILGSKLKNLKRYIEEANRTGQSPEKKQELFDLAAYEARDILEIAEFLRSGAKKKLRVPGVDDARLEEALMHSDKALQELVGGFPPLQRALAKAKYDMTGLEKAWAAFPRKKGLKSQDFVAYVYNASTFKTSMRARRELTELEKISQAVKKKIRDSAKLKGGLGLADIDHVIPESRLVKIAEERELTPGAFERLLLSTPELWAHVDMWINISRGNMPYKEWKKPRPNSPQSVHEVRAAMTREHWDKLLKLEKDAEKKLNRNLGRLDTLKPLSPAELAQRSYENRVLPKRNLNKTEKERLERTTTAAAEAQK